MMGYCCATRIFLRTNMTPNGSPKISKYWTLLQNGGTRTACRGECCWDWRHDESPLPNGCTSMRATPEGTCEYPYIDPYFLGSQHSTRIWKPPSNNPDAESRGFCYVFWPALGHLVDFGDDRAPIGHPLSRYHNRSPPYLHSPPSSRFFFHVSLPANNSIAPHSWQISLNPIRGAAGLIQTYQATCFRVS